LLETPPAQTLLAATVVAGSLVAARYPIVEQTLSKLADWLRRIAFFPNSDVTSELLQLDLLRIALGGFLFTRFWPDFIAAKDVWSHLATGAGLMLSGALTLGIATPIVALLLAFTLNLLIEYASRNYSLGSVVAASCLIPLIVAPAGYTRSIDGLVLMRRSSTIRSIFELWGSPTVDRIQIGRFLALATYATINLYSAIQHLDSSTWRQGAAAGVLLLSPVSSQPWAAGVAQSFYTRAHTMFTASSIASTYLMLFWQMALLPLSLFSRWTRRFVIAWGVLFFAFSTYVLQLKRLGAYELVLWAMIFWNGSPRRPRPLVMMPPRTRVTTALAVSVIALWSLFVVNWITDPKDLRARPLRRAPIVFGMDVVNVFNDRDFALFRHQFIVTRAGGPVSFSTGEAFDIALTLRLYLDLQEPFCDPELATMWLRGFAKAVPTRQPDQVSMEFRSWIRPTNEELVTFQNVPIVWQTGCIVHGDPRHPDQVSIEHPH
jgi:hypothetical protein